MFSKKQKTFDPKRIMIKDLGFKILRGVVRVGGIPTARNQCFVNEHWREGERATGPRALLATSALILFLFLARPLYAQEMTNDFFKIQMGNFNSIAGISGDESYKINITSGETAPNLNVGTSKVKAGFQYIPRKAVFSISVSNTLIDFGTLSPTNPVTRNATISVANLSAPGFTVSASENHQLLSPKNGAIIPDTTCDKGICSQTAAATWTNVLTYGFGYRCDNLSILLRGSKGRGCLKNDLSFYYNQNFYRQFSDASKSEKAATIISGDRGRNQKATITYKVNIPSSQAPGIYTNSITYLAIPTF